MRHLQQMTESGQEVYLSEPRLRMDYSAEITPIEWTTETAAVTEKYSFVSEIARGRFSVVAKGIEKATDRVIVAKILETSGDLEESVSVSTLLFSFLFLTILFWDIRVCSEKIIKNIFNFKSFSILKILWETTYEKIKW